MTQFKVVQPLHPSWTGQVLDFDRVYERILTLSYDPMEERPRPRILGLVTSPRTCAVCGKAEPLVSFRQKAHLIAACLGNRTLFSREDCDACNGESGRELENDLGRMFLAQRTLGAIRSRDGTAKLKGAKGLASVGGGPFDLAVPIVLDPNDNSLQLTETSENSVDLKLPVPTYRPMRAIRSLLRTAWLGLGPSLRASYPWLRDLAVGDKAVEKPEYFEMFLAGGSLGGVLLELWQCRVDSTVPTAPLVLRLAFVNSLLIWCAPRADTFEHVPSLLPTVGSEQPASGTYARLSEPDAAETAKTITYTMTFDERTRAHADGSLASSPRKPRHPAVRVELEGTSGQLSCIETFLVKSNIDSPSPHFEFRGGSLTGWLSVQVRSDRKGTFRFEFAPHQGSVADALSTHQFLTELRESGIIRVINSAAGTLLAKMTKSRSQSEVTLPNIRGFLTDLNSINLALGLNLCVPAPPAAIPREIALIAAGLARGRVAAIPDGPLEITMPAGAARSLLSGERRLLRSMGAPWEVLGTTIDVGPSRVFLVGAVACDPSGLEESLAGKADDDPVEVVLTCERVIHEFDNWLPDSKTAGVPARSGQRPEGE